MHIYNINRNDGKLLEEWRVGSHVVPFEDSNMGPLTVTTIMKNANKIKKAMKTARRKTATTLRYSLVL
jgi:hypothetical protein